MKNLEIRFSNINIKKILKILSFLKKLYYKLNKLKVYL